MMTEDGYDAAIVKLSRLARDLETRLATSIAVTQSIVRGTDPDSSDGREARMALARFQQLLRELGHLSE
jgi:hypothetical protein